MKLLYASSIDIPSTRANRLQVMSMVQAFSKELGSNFIFGLSGFDRQNKPNVPICTVGVAPSWVLAYRYMKIAKEKGVQKIYCREELLLFFMVLLNLIVFRASLGFYYEAHHLEYIKKPWFRYTLKRVSGVITLTNEVRKILIDLQYPHHKILVASDAVDTKIFLHLPTKEKARTKLQLPQNKKIVMYTGTIHEPWKGVGTLYDASALLPDNVLVVVVGGKPHYVEEFNRMYKPRQNIILFGHQPHDIIPQYLTAADVVVLPNTATTEISRLATSPMKLFEYMASGTPIVASDLPSIREVLNESTAVLVEPDNPKMLAQGICYLISNPTVGANLADRAREKVSSYTWEARARAILSFVQ